MDVRWQRPRDCGGMDASISSTNVSTLERRQHVSRFLCEDVDYESQDYIDSLREACNELLICRVQEPNSKDAKHLEATHSLLSAILEDKQTAESTDPTLSSHVCVSSLYAIAIVKFFNVLQSSWIDDYGNVKRVHADRDISLKSIALSAGLPEWFVDCRNRICHSLQPSLILLRQAAFVAVQWLRVNFWQESYLTEVVLECNPTENDAFEALSRLFQTKEKKSRKAAVSAIKKWSSSEFNKKIIVGEAAKYLIRSSRDFSECFEEEENFFIPEELQVMSSPLLVVLRDNELLLTLLQEFIVNFSNEDEFTRKASIVWFFVIVSNISNKNNTSALKLNLKPKGCRLKSGKQKILWIKLLYSVMKSPHKYTPHLVACMRKVLGNTVDETTASLLRKLSTIYVSDAVNPSTDKFVVKTLEDITNVETADKSMGELNELSD